MAVETGFLDLMAFAKGQEMGNQANWSDVKNAQEEQKNARNLAAFDTRFPLLQNQVQSQLSLLDDANIARTASQATAGFQSNLIGAASKLPPEQRNKYIADNVAAQMQNLGDDPVSQRVRQNVHEWSLRQGAELMKTDPASAKQLFDAAGIGTMPQSPEAQVADLNQRINAALQDPNQHFVLGQNGQVIPLAQLRLMTRQLGLGAPNPAQPSPQIQQTPEMVQTSNAQEIANLVSRFPPPVQNMGLDVTRESVVPSTAPQPFSMSPQPTTAPMPQQSLNALDQMAAPYDTARQQLQQSVEQLQRWGVAQRLQNPAGYQQALQKLEQDRRQVELEKTRWETLAAPKLPAYTGNISAAITGTNWLTR